MKFDKEIVIAIAVCCVVLFGWEPFARYMGWSDAPVRKPATVKQATANAVAPPTSVPISKAQTTSDAVSVAVPAKPEPELVPVEPLPLAEFGNKDISFSFDPVLGSIQRIAFLRYRNFARDANIELDQMVSAHGGLAVYQAGTAWCVTQIKENRIETGEDIKSPSRYRLVRRIQTVAGADFQLDQTWTVASEGYEVNYTFKFTNLGHQPLLLDRLILNGGDLASWASISGDKMRTPSHRMDYETVDGNFNNRKAEKKDSDFFLQPPPMVNWAGVSNKYVGMILTATQPFQLFQARTFQVRGKDERRVLTVGARLPVVTLGVGESHSFDFRYYAGPKMTHQLEHFVPSAKRMMHLAWGPLDYLARLLLWILIQLHAFCGSYGISIIILTLLVRLLFYPVTARANASMRRMQALQPKITALREKYKDNPQLLNTKTMELYRQEKVNPLGGCLPILLQIPVFFALYATLDGAVQLRQESFLWAKDLAAADTVAVIPLQVFNLAINPLVLMMTVLMVVQQRMTPMSVDPTQRKMMFLMPFIMLFFLYDLPSGLTLYWTVSNFFSIIQLKLQQKAHPIPAIPVNNPK